MRKRWWWIGLLIVAFNSCRAPKPLEIWPVHLQSTKDIEWGDEPMMRGEQQHYFHGAIGLRETEQRLGHYFKVKWRNQEIGEPVQLKFEYQQSSTGSKIHVQKTDFDAAAIEGEVEFKVIGEEYLKQGRILAWKFTLLRGNREIVTRKSYLWQ